MHGFHHHYGVIHHNGNRKNESRKGKKVEREAEDVKQEDIKAKFENGILSLSVPKPVEQKKVETSKRIAIEG